MDTPYPDHKEAPGHFSKILEGKEKGKRKEAPAAQHVTHAPDNPDALLSSFTPGPDGERLKRRGLGGGGTSPLFQLNKLLHLLILVM
jgi:hypothetical protein